MKKVPIFSLAYVIFCSFLIGCANKQFPQKQFPQKATYNVTIMASDSLKIPPPPSPNEMAINLEGNDMTGCLTDGTCTEELKLAPVNRARLRLCRPTCHVIFLTYVSDKEYVLTNENKYSVPVTAERVTQRFVQLIKNSKNKTLKLTLQPSR